MSDVRWYNEEPKTGGLDVSLWHPYSAPPVTQGGNWNFGASPTDLLNLGKYLLKGAGGLKDLLGLGAAPVSGMPEIMGGSMDGIESMLGPSGALDFAPGAALPAALSAYGGTLGSGAGAGVTGTGSLALGSSAAVPAAAPSIAPVAGEVMGGASFMPTAGASSLLPGLGIAAAPLALIALAKLFGGGGKSHDPEAAALAQFGTPNPTLEAFQEYLDTPEKDRTVDLMRMRDVNGYMPPEYSNAWKQEASDAGLWDLAKGRWATEHGTVLGGTPGEAGGIGPTTPRFSLYPKEESMWEAFRNSPDYIPEDQRPGYVPPTPVQPLTPEQKPVPIDTQLAGGDNLRRVSQGQGDTGPYTGLQPQGPSTLAAELLRRIQATQREPWRPKDYSTWQA